MTAVQYLTTLINFRSAGDRGANLVEYAILVGFIALVAIGAVAALGGTTSSEISDITSRLG